MTALTARLSTAQLVLVALVLAAVAAVVGATAAHVTSAGSPAGHPVNRSCLYCGG